MFSVGHTLGVPGYSTYPGSPGYTRIPTRVYPDTYPGIPGYPGIYPGIPGLLTHIISKQPGLVPGHYPETRVYLGTSPNMIEKTRPGTRVRQSIYSTKHALKRSYTLIMVSSLPFLIQPQKFNFQSASQSLHSTINSSIIAPSNSARQGTTRKKKKERKKNFHKN